MTCLRVCATQVTQEQQERHLAHRVSQERTSRAEAQPPVLHVPGIKSRQAGQPHAPAMQVCTCHLLHQRSLNMNHQIRHDVSHVIQASIFLRLALQVVHSALRVRPTPTLFWQAARRACAMLDTLDILLEVLV